MDVLDRGGDRRRERVISGINVEHPIVANGIICVRGGDALFPDDFGEDLLCLSTVMNHSLMTSNTVTFSVQCISYWCLCLNYDWRVVSCTDFKFTVHVDSLHNCSGHIFHSPTRGVRSILMNACVCLSVCLSARISLKPNGRISPNFYACWMWPWLGPCQVALRYVCTSGFVDGVMFSHSGLMARHGVCSYISERLHWIQPYFAQRLKPASIELCTGVMYCICYLLFPCPMLHGFLTHAFTATAFYRSINLVFRNISLSLLARCCFHCRLFVCYEDESKVMCEFFMKCGDWIDIQ